MPLFLAFEVGSITSCFRVETTDDTVLEEDEDLVITLSSTSSNVVIVGVSSVTVQITNNDGECNNGLELSIIIIFNQLLGVTVGFQQSVYAVTEGETVEICSAITSGSSDIPLVIAVSTVNETAQGMPQNSHPYIRFCLNSSSSITYASRILQQI